jgi:hypothetical protein
MTTSNDPDRLVLQKLLTADLGRAIVDDGYDQVGGIVVSAADAAPLDTPDRLLHAYGFDVTGLEFVDVVRFTLPALASLTNPVAPDARRTPLYPTGFLTGDAIVPVWELSRTRYSYGAEYWRIRVDGEQRCLSSDQGVARGWRGAQGWRPWSPLVGPRARWRGAEFAADVVGDSVLLSVRAETGPDGWEQVRPETWVAAVPAGECELFEVVLSATWQGVPVRVLSSGPAGARVLLLIDDADRAEALGATVVEPGVFEATVSVDELTDRRGVTNELPPPTTA